MNALALILFAATALWAAWPLLAAPEPVRDD